MHFNVYCGTIYNGQDTEASLMSINRGTYKEDAAHLYNRILLSYKKKKMKFAEMWMDLGTVIQSEANQKEKNKYHILTHICGN